MGPRTFDIQRCLGRGGFGEVYLASMVGSGRLEREVAVKVLRRDIDPDGQAVRRLRDEGRLLAKLDHPAILKVEDLILLDGRISLVTEYVDGHDLTACLHAPDAIGPRALLQVLARVCGALHAAWSTAPEGGAPLRMVHRDIKPSNIRVSRHGDVKLLDFGIARTDALERESRTRTGTMVGSPAYMAPERFLDEGVLLASDVFSVGAVLYEGVVGERFYGTLPVPLQVGLAVDPARYGVHLEERLVRVGHDELRALLACMLVADPSDRPEPGVLGSQLEGLADRVPGPSLARYARDRDWYETSADRGDLDGQCVTESLLAPPKKGSLSQSLLPQAQAPMDAPTLAPPPAAVERLEPTLRVPSEPAARPTEGRWVVPTILVALAFLSAGFVLSGGLLTSMLVVGVPSAPPPEVVPVEMPQLPEPVLIEPTQAEPEAVAPSPGPAVPRPAPEVVVEERPVAPPPLVTVAPARLVLSTAGIATIAKGPFGRIRLPGHVPPGVITLEASFNGVDMVDAGTLTVQSGDEVTISCSKRMRRCDAR